MYYEIEEIEEMLPEIIKKYIVINPYYKLQGVSIEDFEVDGHKLMFEIVADCEFED